MAITKTLYALPDKIVRRWIHDNASSKKASPFIGPVKDTDLPQARRAIEKDTRIATLRNQGQTDQTPSNEYFEHDGEVLKVRHLKRENVSLPDDKDARKARAIAVQADMRATLLSKLGLRVTSVSSNDRENDAVTI